MKFSFIMPVYEGIMVVARCLESLHKQTDKDFEIIVVNDGHNPVMQKMVMADDRLPVKYYENEFVGRKGGYLSVDSGITNASLDSEYLYVLSGDCIIRPEFVEKMYKAAQEEDAHIVTCQVWMHDMHGHILHGRTVIRGAFDRANYCVPTLVAKEVRYRDLNMQQDDYWFWRACYDYINERGHVRTAHVDEVLAEHH